MTRAATAPRTSPSEPSQRIAPLRTRIRRVLDESAFDRANRVSLDVHGDQVGLRGRVASYYEKQLAQTIVMNVPGVHSVVNDLVVVRPR